MAEYDIDLSGAVWRKANMSAQNGSCVEVARLAGAVAVRDSKDPDGAKLVFAPAEWESFLDGAAKGEFNLNG